jgi:hypothetical protein
MDNAVNALCIEIACESVVQIQGPFMHMSVLISAQIFNTANTQQALLEMENICCVLLSLRSLRGKFPWTEGGHILQSKSLKINLTGISYSTKY